MFISLLVCFVAIIVMAVAIAIIWAPLSIEIRINKEKSIEFQIGDCMPDVWVCSYWFAILVHGWSEDGKVEYSYIVYHFWEMNEGKYINGKTEPDYDDYYNDVDAEKDMLARHEQDDDEHWNELVERARARREQFDEYL